MQDTLPDLLTQASAKLGLDPVTSITSDTEDNITWGAIWRPVLHRCLSIYRWNFSTRTQELSRLLAAPDLPGYQYQFDLPSDFHVVRAVLGAGGLSTVDWTYDDGRLLSNSDRVFLRYGRTYNESTITALPNWFAAFFVSSLAYEASEKLVGIGSVRDSIGRDTGVFFGAAKTRDAELVPRTQIGPGRWTGVRWGGLRWGR